MSFKRHRATSHLKKITTTAKEMRVKNPSLTHQEAVKKAAKKLHPKTTSIKKPVTESKVKDALKKLGARLPHGYEIVKRKK